MDFNLNNMNIEQAKQVLKENGYYVDNLWHTDDVHQFGDISEDGAYDVLDSVLQNAYTIEKINEMLHDEFYERTN